MVSYYHDNLALDGIILRVDELFFCPRSSEECQSVYAAACRSAVVHGQLSINSKLSRSGLWVRDLAQALFVLIRSPGHRRSLYHVTGESVLSGSEMARIIQNGCSREILVEDLAADVQRSIRL